MVLTAARALKHVRHTLGESQMAPSMEAMDMVNQSGEHLCSMHGWKWLEGRSVNLDLEGQITATTCEWRETSKSVVKSGGFSSYTHQDGDTLQVTAGANVDATGIQSTTTIAKKLNDDVIVLEASIGSGADGDTDIGVQIDQSRVVLPSDFRSMIGVSATDSLLDSLYMTSYQQLLVLRTHQIEVTSSWNYYGAITHKQTTGEGVTPILEIWPTPTTDDANAFTMFYRAGWAPVSDDDEILSLPAWLEPLYLQLLRAFVRGYEMEDDGSLHLRLQEIEMSPLYRAAKTRDGMIQPEVGPLRGGAVRSMENMTVPLLSTQVEAPT